MPDLPDNLDLSDIKLTRREQRRQLNDALRPAAARLFHAIRTFRGAYGKVALEKVILHSLEATDYLDEDES